jgi:hypothetical protein
MFDVSVANWQAAIDATDPAHGDHVGPQRLGRDRGLKEHRGGLETDVLACSGCRSASARAAGGRAAWLYEWLYVPATGTGAVAA